MDVVRSGDRKSRPGDEDEDQDRADLGASGAPA
jgi:hypothetical protein